MNQPVPQTAGGPADAPSMPATTSSRRATWGRRFTMAALVILSGAFFLYLLVPVIALLVHAPPSEIWAQMKEPDVLKAVQLSLVTTAIATALAFVFGLPTAIVLARGRFFVTLPNYAYDISVHSWGWFHLIAGIVVFIAGAALLSLIGKDCEEDGFLGIDANAEFFRCCDARGNERGEAFHQIGVVRAAA